MSLLVLFQGPLSGAPPPSPAFHYAHPSTDVFARDRAVTAAEGLVAAALLAVDHAVPSTDTAPPTAIDPVTGRKMTIQ